MPTDQPDKAHEFYVMKRAGAGAPDLPYEKYIAAEKQAGAMRHYSLATRRFSAGALVRSGELRGPGALVGSADVRGTGAARSEGDLPGAGADLGGWESLGPGNQGGRTRALLIHPSDPKIMYAGAATGGVWKTTDAGANWKPVTDAFPSLGIGALAFEPGNPGTIYAGTGFWFNSLSGTNALGSAPRGAGIFRSRDAGATWERLPQPDGIHFRYINEIIVSRQDVNRIYAATWTGIFRSRDGGRNWTQIVNRGTGSQNGCQDMVARPDTGTDYLFASCGTTEASVPVILRKEDAAQDGEWQTVYTNRLAGNTTLAIAPSSPSTIYALSAGNLSAGTWNASLLGVWRSTANGDPDTWEARVTNADAEPLNTSLLSNNQSFFFNVCFNGARNVLGQGWIHNAIAVDPQDPERVFVGGIDVYRSDDGGKNWGLASFWQAADGLNGAHADVLGLVFPPDYDGESRPFLYAATDGGVYITDNARAELATGPRAACQPYQNRVRWRPLHGGMQTTQFYSGAVLPGGGAFFGGKQDNGTMRGSLANLRDWLRLSGGDGSAVAVDPRNANVVFASTQGFGLLRSVNGGQSFTAATRGTLTTDTFSFIAPLAIDAVNPDRLYAGGRYFYRTDDQATQWMRISNRLLEPLEGTVSAIAVAPSDGTRVLMATSSGFIFRTGNAVEANAETVWEGVRPRPGFVPALAFDPTNADVAYAVYSQFKTTVDQSHVYRTRDGGRTWEGIDGAGDTSVPDVPVLAVMVDPQDTSRIYLGTDLGVFVSVDGGTSWSRDQSPFAAVPTEALQIERGGGASYLYAFTFGRGVWRTLLPGTGTPCEYNLVGAQTANFPAIGGDAGLNVETREGCTWTAIGVGPTGTLPSIVMASPPSATGSGPVRAGVQLNYTQAARTLQVSVQNRSATIRQAAAVAIAPASNLFESAAEIALPYVGVRDTRTNTATPETDKQPSCFEGPPQKTSWLKFTPAESGKIEVALLGQRYDVFGNSGVVVTAYPAEGAGVGGELACGAVPRDLVAWRYGLLAFDAAAGKTYFLQVSATGNTTVDGGYTVVGVQLRR